MDKLLLGRVLTYERTHPPPEEARVNSTLLVVAIGSSAGGLEALSQLVAALPQQLGCFYVIAQHISPTHQSMLAEILARETSLPVREIVAEECPQPDVIYIIPPGNNMVFEQGHFHLLPPLSDAPKPSDRHGEGSRTNP